MKNRLSLLPFLLSLLCACSDSVSEFAADAPGNDDAVIASVLDNYEPTYYWNHGEKVVLTPNPDKYYVLRKAATTENGGNKEAAFAGRGAKELKYADLEYIDDSSKPDGQLFWSIETGSQMQRLKSAGGDADGVIYEMPFYQSSLGGEIGISHLFYVKLNSDDDKDTLMRFAEERMVKIVGNDKFLPLWYTLSCENADGSALDMANEFYESGLFAAAEPDIMVDLKSTMVIGKPTPNDTYFKQQWNLISIEADSPFYFFEGNGISVAIIDTGIEEFHPDMDFGSGLVGYDLVSGSLDVGNVVYGPHGTACAGIIKAKRNNSTGIAGIASGSTIISLCHPMTQSPNAIQQLANGLEIAATHYDVLSCSWGHPALTSSMIEDALKYYAFAWGRNGKGCVVVFSSGNDFGKVTFPANCNEKILVVGAYDQNEKRCDFSNYGPELDVMAPGVAIPTTDLLGAQGYSATDYHMDFQGTSAACPHVAAVAACVLSANPDLKGDEVHDIITKTACPIIFKHQLVKDNETGYGKVNLESAVKEARNRINNN